MTFALVSPDLLFAKLPLERSFSAVRDPGTRGRSCRGRRMAVHNVQVGTLKECLSYISFGEGPPLLVFPGLYASNANPTGFLLRFEMGGSHR